MEKKEYQSPKMEIVEMAAFGELLAASLPDHMGAFIDDSDSEYESDEDY